MRACSGARAGSGSLVWGVENVVRVRVGIEARASSGRRRDRGGGVQMGGARGRTVLDYKVAQSRS